MPEVANTVSPRPSRTLRMLYVTYRAYSTVSYWIEQRFSPTGLMILMGLPVTAAMGLDTNQAATYQIFCFLVVMVLIALALGRFSRPDVAVTRELPPFASAGEPVGYWLTVENREKRPQRSLALRETLADPRPNFAEFANRVEPGEAKRNWIDRFFRFYRWQWLVRRNRRGQCEEVAVPDLPVNGRHAVRMTMQPLRRGVVRFEGTAVVCPEPFGLYRSPVRHAAPASVLVLPKRYRLPPFEFPGTVRYQQGGVALASSVGESEEFASLRDYRRGDPLTRIHWKSWARAGKPIVKEFQQEYFVRHALVLDTFAGEDDLDSFEEAVSLAASLACTVDKRDSLLDLLFMGNRAHCFTAGRGVGHAEQLLELLATVEPCGSHDLADLERLVQSHAGLVGGCICLFVGWDAPRRQLVEGLQQAGIPVMVLVVRASESVEIDSRDLRLGGEDSFHVVTAGDVETGLRQL